MFHSTRRVHAVLISLPLCFCVASRVCAQSPNLRDANADWKVVAVTVEEHCVYCHDGTTEDRPAGDVDFAANVKSLDTFLASPRRVHRTLEVVSRHEMPPETEGELTAETHRSLTHALKRLLAEAVKRSPQPQTQIRRMNRFQYNNAVRDLFELKCEVYSLPERMMREHKNYFRPETGKMADTVYVGSRPLGKSQMIEPRLGGVAPFPQDLRAEHGYDNQADHLSMSPLLMESFLRLGKSVVESPSFDEKRVGIWQGFFVSPEAKKGVALEESLRGRVHDFLHRAFRRPPEPATVDRYVQYAAHRIDSGEPYTEVMKSVAAAVISSPKFLYLYSRSDRDADESVWEQPLEKPSAAEKTGRVPLDSYELATRLAFFLWASLPDQRLLELAESNELSREDVLLKEVDRMLRDQKLKGFCDSFPSQWLQLERIISSTPDPQLYRDFYFSKYRNSMHMMMEPLLLFETVLIEDRPITELIDPKFTYRSLHLRKAYGEDLSKTPPKPKRRAGEVTILTFDRIPVEDRRYGGVITNAAVMTMTSGPLRTQPITRGAWLATVIFNDPPQPPPADVPPLDEKADEDDSRTLRERLALHRERADCRGCHEKLDPLGFALENYDVVGRWRDQYENGTDVDTAGKLFHKQPFADPVEFKDAILAERERFAAGFVEHLLTFAMARQLEPADAQAVEDIVEAAEQEDFRLQSILKQVVLSEPFCTKVPEHQSP